MPVGTGALSVARVLAESDHHVIQVQRRTYRGGSRGGYRGSDIGAGVVAGIVGLAIGGMIAAEQQRQNTMAYCASRFRSYNPETGTYIGRGGRVYRCP